MPLELIINRIDNENSRIRVLYLSAADGSDLPGYSPGAHIDVILGDIGTRSYSLIDFSVPPEEPFCYCIAVQREDDGQGGSRAMHELKLGDLISAVAPANDFELSVGESPVILLAGGIGVTPLISMATQLIDTGADFSFNYSTRSLDSMVFRKQLEENFSDQLTLYIDDDNPLQLDTLFTSADTASSVYICGPRGMIDAARAAALSAGLSADNIRIELFVTPVAEVGDQDFEVEIYSTGQVYTIPAGQTIIEVLEEAELDIVYDCQRGDCGICQTDVISGTPDHRDVVLSDEERASGKSDANMCKPCKICPAGSGSIVPLSRSIAPDIHLVASGKNTEKTPCCYATA